MCMCSVQTDHTPRCSVGDCEEPGAYPVYERVRRRGPLGSWIGVRKKASLCSVHHFEDLDHA